MIDNTGIILGEDASRRFGSGLPSTYLEIPIGVMLTGNMERMLLNLSHLPNQKLISPLQLCYQNSECLSASAECSVYSGTSSEVNIRKEYCHYEKVSHNVSHKDILVCCKDLKTDV